GAWAEARELYERQLELGERLGDRSLQASGVGGLAACEYADGSPAEAAALYQRAAKLNGDADPQHCLEDLAGALVSWAAAGRVQRLGSAAQRLVEVAQKHGREILAGEAI